MSGRTRLVLSQDDFEKLVQGQCVEKGTRLAGTIEIVLSEIGFYAMRQAIVKAVDKVLANVQEEFDKVLANVQEEFPPKKP